jgi:hypothetical protein
MVIEWWEVAIPLSVAGVLAWSRMRRITQLGLNQQPKVQFAPHATALGGLRFASDKLRDETGPLEEAHKHCFKNRAELAKSLLCGCFYCEKTFPPAKIDEWVDEGQTAMCPFCGIDSVLGSASGLELGKAFLHCMNERWF